MRKAALVTLVVAIAAWGTRVSVAEMPTACIARAWEYPPGAGYETPEKAVEAATPLEAPPSLDEGTSEIGKAEVEVIELDAGFVLGQVVKCDTKLVVTFGAGAQAHPPTDAGYENDPTIAGLETWPGANPNATYHYTAEVAQSFRTRINNAFDEWEVNSDSVNWTIGSQHANSNGEFTGLDTDCGRINDEIHHEEIGGTAAGVATWCWNAQGDITRFEMGFDDDITWYTGAPGSITDQDYDLGAVATHEVGHATGMAHHFVEPQDDCTGSDRQTMCPGQGFGETWRQTIELHDIHTSEMAYD